MRRVQATIVAVEKQWVLHNMSVCICSVMYPACNAHAPYWSVVGPVLQYFSTLPHKGHDFRKKSFWLQEMCILILSTFFVWNIPHSKKK